MENSKELDFEQTQLHHSYSYGFFQGSCRKNHVVSLKFFRGVINWPPQATWIWKMLRRGANHQKTVKTKPLMPCNAKMPSCKNVYKWRKAYWNSQKSLHTSTVCSERRKCSRIVWAKGLSAAKQHCKRFIKPTKNGLSTVSPSLSCHSRMSGSTRHTLTKRPKT